MTQPDPLPLFRRCNRCRAQIRDWQPGDGFLCGHCEADYRNREGRYAYGADDPDATDHELDRDDPGIRRGRWEVA